MIYSANSKRYDDMTYSFCGNSGIKLSNISLGLWHNFGDATLYSNSYEMVKYAFDNGITHFDIANNYGPPSGAAERNFGKILKEGLGHYRDEIIISTKAGYYNFPGPYGDGGSKKYLVSSLDKSLKNMGIDYVDIYYHHRFDSETPLEETMGALDLLVKQGKALYIGVSNYNGENTKKAVSILKSLGTPCFINQPVYSMLRRDAEHNLFNVLEEENIGCIPFSPLAQGLLTDRYFNGIPKDSRAGGTSVFLNDNNVTDEIINKTKSLNEIAKNRGQKLSEMALAWVLRQKVICSVLIGASKISQIEDAINSTKNLDFSQEELQKIDNILND